MKQIYKYLFAAGFACYVATSAMAQSVVTTNGVMVSDIAIVPHDDRVNVDMLFDMSDLRVRSNYSLQITPILTNGREMVQLPPVVIDGRRRSMVHKRQDSDLYESIKTYVRRRNNKDQVMEYDADIPMEQWMIDSELILKEEWCSCHDIPLSEELVAVATVSEPVSVPSTFGEEQAQQPQPQGGENLSPRVAYVMPAVSGEQSEMEEMDIYFAVNKSDINASFMDNSEEMKSVAEALSQGGVSKVHLVGYASPEGPYEFNKQLAARRAEAVKSYLANHNLSKDITVTSDSSPANWDEVKRKLGETFIENWRGIVAIIDDPTIAPADKNGAIRKKYPVEYDFMLTTWYPKLRVTEISVEGAPKRHTVEQAKALMQSAPSQLSLEDIYMVALTYDKGSKEWSEIILFAVERFPLSPEARVNAANVAMANGDYELAAEYLQGVPANMPQAINSRGILAMSQGNYGEAMTLFKLAEQDGVSEASYNIGLLDELIEAQAQ